MGGRHPLGLFAFVLLVSLTSLVWLTSQSLRAEAKWTWTGAEGLLTLGCLLVIAQLIHWPAKVLATISPAIAELLPLWTAENEPWFQFGEWTCLSLAPTATQAGLVTFMAYCLLFFLVVQYVQDIKDVQRILWWIACATIGMAAIGLAQFLFGNGKFLWIYSHPMRTTYGVVKGTFINENHFAHFIAMGLGPMIWWLRNSITKSNEQHPRGEFSTNRFSVDASTLKASLFIGLGCVCVAGLMSFSRGGVMMMFFAASVTVGLFTCASLLGRNSIVALIGIGAMVGTSLIIFGGDRLSQEMGTITASHSMTELLDVRLTLWKAMLQAHEKFRWFGTGVGSHAEVYPIFFSDYSIFEYTHGESGYFHLLEETGLIGLGLMITGTVCCLRWCHRAFQNQRDREIRACAFVVFAGLLTSILHSLFDFVWYIPSCMSLAVIYAALACRLSQLGLVEGRSFWSKETVFSPMLWRLGTVLVAGGLALMVVQSVRSALASVSWDEYLRISLANDPTSAPSEEQTENMLSELNAVLYHEPNHARAQIRLASLCLLRFEQRQRENDNAMSVSQIREAAFASKFPTKAAQSRWLQAAFGDNYPLLLKAANHARRGAQLCPLQGEAYLILGELTFLESPLPSIKRNYFAQALRVRPNHGGILVAVGGEIAMDGDFDRAMRFWRIAFRQDPIQRAKLLEILGKLPLSAEFFIEQFQPDRMGLTTFYQFFRSQNRNEDAQFVGRKLVVLLEENATKQRLNKAADAWREAREIYLFLKESDKALECARNTSTNAPSSIHDRKSLAKILLDCDRVDEAIQELQWCKSRKPDDLDTLDALKSANRRRVAAGTTLHSKQDASTRTE